MADKKPPKTPDLQHDFYDAELGAEEPMPDHELPEPDPLDHLDLATWDYTPGGTIEEQVHVQLSDANRREYQRRMQGEPEPAEDYRSQLDAQFQQSIDAEEAARLRQEHEDELAAKEAEQIDLEEAIEASKTVDENDTAAQPLSGPRRAANDWREATLKQQSRFDMPKDDVWAPLHDDPEAKQEYENYLTTKAEDERAKQERQEPTTHEEFNVEAQDWSVDRGSDGHGHE